MRLYISGPMSRSSFCRCNRPSPRSALSVSANLVGPREGNAVPPTDVLVGHSGSAVSAHRGLVRDRTDGALLPECDLLDGAGRPALTEEGEHVSQEPSSGVPVDDPDEELLSSEPVGGMGTTNISNPAAPDHEVKDVTVSGTDLDAQGSLVGGAIDDGAFAFVEASTPSGVGKCPFHDFILPDDGVDPWDYNVPAFNKAAHALREAGYQVTSPADTGVHDGWEWADYLRSDLRLLTRCGGIALLDGWQDSRGARLEHHVAAELGMDVRPLADWLDGEPA